MNEDRAISSGDISKTAWIIAAKHLTAGQRDVTKMIEEGILQERRRCTELLEAALGPEADRVIFVAHPEAEW